MKIADMKVTELINAVGSDAPAPGGGAVAGLAGGIGVALTMMVNGLTLSKKGFEDDRERILDAIAKGNDDPEKIAAWLKQLKDLPTLSGKMGFDEKGDRVGDFYRIYKVDNAGKFELQAR